MAKLITEYRMYIFAVVKIAVMFGFFLQIAPILVFAERRQASLIQDRLGPNRAVVGVPGMILKGALSVPAFLAAGVLGLLVFVVFPTNPQTDAVRGFWMGQAAIAGVWSNLLFLYGALKMQQSAAKNPLEEWLLNMSDQRWIFYTGAIAHVLLTVAYGGLTPDNAKSLAPVFAYGGPAALIGALALVGAYVGYRIPGGRVEIRLAGILHSIADTLKLLFKEDFIPKKADRLLHGLAPIIAVFPAFVTFAVIPFGDNVCFAENATGGMKLTSLVQSPVVVDGIAKCGKYTTSLQILDVNVGILYMFAVAGTGIIGAALAGWSSDNKWSLLGGLRAASQMVSYEVAMGLSLAGAFMVYGSPRLNDMVRWQQENAWGIFVQPLAFFLFFASSIAEQKRVPFDAPEGESEIVAGYFVEYSSMKFVMFYTGEYIEMAVSSAVLVTIFLGGWSLPFMHADGLKIAFADTVLYQSKLSHLTVVILQILTFFGKTSLLAFGQIFIRWTVPRFRYDQIMAFGWKMLLPASIANLVLTGLGLLVLDKPSPTVKATLDLMCDISQGIVVVVVAYVLFKFVKLLLSPVERKEFSASTAALRAARLGGVKESTMQA